MRRGFTLVELLLALSILGVIAVITLTAFQGVLTSQALTRGVHDVASIIEDARKRTMAGENDIAYGVVIATTTVTLVRAPEYDVSSSTSVVFNLPSAIELQSAILSTTTITFDPLTGDASEVVELMYAHKRSTTTTRGVTIESSGLVSVE